MSEIIDKKYTWAVEDIYGSAEEWEKDFEYVKKNCDFNEFRGKLNDKKCFLLCMKKNESLVRVVDKLAVYAMMNHDKDTRNSYYDSLNSRVQMLCSEFSEKTAFIVPELTNIKEETLNSYISDKQLSDYDYFLKTILKSKAHVLTEKEERLLALSGESISTFKDIFTKIDNADLPLKPVKYKGEIYPLSHGTYGVYMQSQDRKLRKKVFESYYNSYVSLINTISATYYGNVKKNIFISKARNYPSVLSMMLEEEDVSPKVYDNLITSVKKALPLLHKYMSVKKQALGLKKMEMYDVYVPTVSDADLKLDYESAYDLVEKGLSVLGKDYVSLLEKARKERWLDVVETEGKRSGAYSVAVYDTHPYVLLNYQKTTHDVFTIAHEMGHSLHSYFSNKNQPYEKADYKIFVAEVASTVNEVLLIRYLLKQSNDDKLKSYLLSYLLEMIRTTLFRQTQFSEFEEFAHKMAQDGVPLTKDNLTQEYARLNKKYYGKSVNSNGLIGYEWARIPHFYRAFYVYKYSTGIISALSIADRILTEGEKATKDYFGFLSSGGSDSPVELLKIAGVDLNTLKPFESAFKVFEDALNEFIILQDKIK